jgi:hypothetical protein
MAPSRNLDVLGSRIEDLNQLVPGVPMSRAASFDIPRWEWRIFSGTPMGMPQILGDDRSPGPAHSEIRILCLNNTHDVLIQDEALSLKWRKQVGPGGLEIWDSILNSSFPCPSEVALRLFEALGLPAPRLARSHYSQTQFISEIIPQNAQLHPVEILKRLRPFHLEGAACEWAELATDRFKVESLCIEHEDPELVLQVVEHLGLQSSVNTSYSQGLKTALHLSSQP